MRQWAQPAPLPAAARVTGTPDDLDRLRLVASAMAGRPLTLERAAADTVTATAPSPRDLAGDVAADLLPETDDDEAEDTIPLGSLSRLLSGGIQTGLSRWLTKKFGGRGLPEDGDGGAELPMGGARTVSQLGVNSRVCLFPVTLQPTEIDSERGRGWCY